MTTPSNVQAAAGQGDGGETLTPSAYALPSSPSSIAGKPPGHPARKHQQQQPGSTPGHREGEAPAKRERLTQAELTALRSGIIQLALQFGPIGVRGLFYQCVVAGLVEKTEQAYDRVQRMVKDARLAGDLDWDRITDESRACQRVGTFSGIEDLLSTALACFHLDPWANQPCRVQIWVEKEGLAPICREVTDRYCVPLYPGKGYTSLSFSRQAALAALDALAVGQRVVVLQWGDYDPSGVNISESLAEHYRIHGAGEAEVIRVGLKAEHIGLFGLPTRPTKTSDRRAKNFGDDRSVELDALPPAQFKQWLETEIRRYIDLPAWERAIAEETAQRQTLEDWLEGRAA
jgi:hypothetical protein